MLCVCVMVCAGVLRELVVDQERRLRAVEREGRRRRRREQRDRQPVSSSVRYDGQSSDDELLESDRMNFSSKTSECYLGCHHVPVSLLALLSTITIDSSPFLQHYKHGL